MLNAWAVQLSRLQFRITGLTDLAVWKPTRVNLSPSPRLPVNFSFPDSFSVRSCPHDEWSAAHVRVETHVFRASRRVNLPTRRISQCKLTWTLRRVWENSTY
jgi:hypothetical protein